MMVVGSTINDVMKVTPPPPGALKDEKSGTSGGVGWGDMRHVCNICLSSRLLYLKVHLKTDTTDAKMF